MCLTLPFIPRARMVDTEKERHVPTTHLSGAKGIYVCIVCIV